MIYSDPKKTRELVRLHEQSSPTSYKWPEHPEPEVYKRGAIRGRSGKGKNWSLSNIQSRRVEEDIRYLISHFDVYFPASDFITVKRFRTGYKRTEYTAVGKGPDGEKIKYWAMEGLGGDRRIRLWVGKEEVTPDRNEVTGWPILVESMDHLIKYLEREDTQIKRYQPIEGIEWS